MTLRVLSLFSGAGGMDLGLEGAFLAPSKSLCIDKPGFTLTKKLPFETVFANDILKEAQTAWTNYFKRFYPDADTRFHLESIVDLCKRHQTGEHIFPDNIDVVTGGFPCQDFSLAGKRRGFNSERGQLYIWMKQVIDIVRPKIFIAENVKGLTSLGNALEIIRNDFASSGYIVVEPRVLKAWEYGVPESRERVIFIGLRRDALTLDALNAYSSTTASAEIKEFYDPYPKKTHGDNLFSLVTCADVLGHLKEPEEETEDLSQMSYSTAKYLGPGKQGQTEIKWDGLGPTIRSEHHGNIEYRRLSKEHGGRLVDPVSTNERRLTPRECALIQTFPPDYQFVSDNPKLTRSGAYKVIGNAVPPMLAYNIGKRIAQLYPLIFKKERD